MPVFSWNEVTAAVRPDYDGMDYAERETLKREAWRRYRQEGASLASRVSAIEDVIRAHYDRSREAYRGKHPGFFRFACHWVAASEDLLDEDLTVRTALTAKYPAPRIRHIADGQSCWSSRPAALKRSDPMPRKRRATYTIGGKPFATKQALAAAIRALVGRYRCRSWSRGYHVAHCGNNNGLTCGSPMA